MKIPVICYLGYGMASNKDKHPFWEYYLHAANPMEMVVVAPNSNQSALT